MRIIFKILALPFVAALTITGAAFAFILFLSAWIFYIAAFVIGALSLVALFSGDTYVGVANLIIAFVIFILPTIAEWITDRLGDLNDSLKLFITT